VICWFLKPLLFRTGQLVCRYDKAQSNAVCRASPCVTPEQLHPLSAARNSCSSMSCNVPPRAASPEKQSAPEKNNAGADAGAGDFKSKRGERRAASRDDVDDASADSVGDDEELGRGGGKRARVTEPAAGIKSEVELTVCP
jgi:hypothetical protein